MSHMPPEHSQAPDTSPYVSRNVTAVLGPTNTGKTHLAIERMLGHETGVIGLPLRLLAREVYDRVVKKVGADQVALITGEEKIKPSEPKYYVCTVEAMPQDLDLDFAAIDEVQLAADQDRGHTFTDRLLHTRGSHETLLLGSGTMRNVIAQALPGANFISRPRLSNLSYSGEKKVSRLPRRTAIVAFSASDVYAVAELIRRQRGGAAVVLGALSPRTRNAQVALYQSGDVDFIVATDAIGMGLNLDVNHVAFAGVRKFDGHSHRELSASEIGQIAGRAGRHLNDGTFGVTGDVPPFESELVQQLEEHEFEPVKLLQWRNRALDYSSIEALKTSLIQPPTKPFLARAALADDLIAREYVTRLAGLIDQVKGRDDVHLLWDVCQIPDYQKVGSSQHAELVASIFQFLREHNSRIPDDWFENQIKVADRTDGDIDTLATRIAHVRTWTFVANRSDWLSDPEHWQGRTREIEDRLSDALHEKLTQRFVDRKTSTLMKRLRDEEELEAKFEADGRISVEDHHVGRLSGFLFTPESHTDDLDGKAARHAAARVLEKELGMRARKLVAAKSDAFKLTPDAHIAWRDEPVARLEKSTDWLRPTIVPLVDDHLSGPDQEKVAKRLAVWWDELLGDKLKPLVDLSDQEQFSGLARGVAYQLYENFGALKRENVANDVKALDQTARGQLRKCGVRFGAFNIFIPALLKPAPSEAILTLWNLNGGASELTLEEGKTVHDYAPRAGLTSIPADAKLSDAFYRLCGFHLCGPRGVRIDMLERLADMIRPLIAYRDKPSSKADKAPQAAPAKPAGDKAEVEASAAPASDAAAAETAPEAASPTPPSATSGAVTESAEQAATPSKKSAEKPAGATGDGGFVAQPDMMSILGCSADELAAVLKSLGFRMEKRALAVEASAANENEPVGSSEAPDSEAAQEPNQEQGAAATADAEEAFEIIWRPKRRGPPRRHRGGSRSADSAGKRSSKGRKPTGGQGKPRGKPQQREQQRRWSSGGGKKAAKAVDPDNPFAALGALKDQLEKKP